MLKFTPLSHLTLTNMNQETAQATAADTAVDFLPLNGTDYIEFYVGNAKQSAHYYQSAFGYELVAYAGPETGIRDRASYVLQQDKIRIILTTSLKNSALSEFIYFLNFFLLAWYKYNLFLVL